MRNPITHTLPTLALLAAVTTASCAQVEADVPEAKVTQKSVKFEGTGGRGQWPGEASTMQSFQLSSTNLSWMKELNSKVYVTEIDLTAVSGVEDLSFIHYAHVSISDDDKKGFPIEIANYLRPDNMSPTAVLKVKTSHPIDITKVWTAKKLRVNVAVGGDLPAKSWSVDVTIYLSGSISYKL